MIKQLIRYALFPIMLFAGVWLLLFSLDKGYDLELISILIATLTVIVVHLSERVLPFKKEWNVSQGDMKSDVLSLSVILALLEPITKTLSTWLLSLGLLYLSELTQPDIFPHEWPLLAQLVLFALGAEFGRYWMHRFSHQNAVLWRFHASHHSAERLYQFNGYRIHPLNYLWNYFLGQFPLILMGASGDLVMLYFALSSIVAAFQHSNIDSRNAMLNWIFSTNELHRWHHSTDRSIGDKNHGSVLIIWDWVFGSYYLPKDSKQVDTVGLYSAAGYPVKSYLKQLVVPFCWNRCVENRKN